MKPQKGTKGTKDLFRKPFLCLLCLFAALCVLSCRRSGSEKRYDLKGKVVVVEPDKHLVTVSHDDIKGYMPAMTMEFVVSAPDRPSLVARTRALDRALLWGHYIIPNFHIAVHRIAAWDKFGRPAIGPKYATGYPDTWWLDPAKAAALRGRMASGR